MNDFHVAEVLKFCPSTNEFILQAFIDDILERTGSRNGVAGCKE